MPISGLEAVMLENKISNSAFKNCLGLFDQEGNIDVDKTAEIMDISRNQLAEVFGLSSEQIRPDRLSEKAAERVKELAAALDFVAETFNSDVQKTKYWIKTPNHNFGGSTPRDLILRGRYKRVLSFILAAKK
jgi:hypothetical protein